MQLPPSLEWHVFPGQRSIYNNSTTGVEHSLSTMSLPHTLATAPLENPSFKNETMIARLWAKYCNSVIRIFTMLNNTVPYRNLSFVYRIFKGVS